MNRIGARNEDEVVVLILRKLVILMKNMAMLDPPLSFE